METCNQKSVSFYRSRFPLYCFFSKEGVTYEINKVRNRKRTCNRMLQYLFCPGRKWKIFYGGRSSTWSLSWMWMKSIRSPLVFWERGKRRYYSVNMSRKEFIAKGVQEYLNLAYDGSLLVFLRSLEGDHGLSEEHKQELQQFVKEQQEKEEERQKQEESSEKTE